MVWVRLGPEDRDPGLFLASLVAAVQRTSAGFGRATLELMRAQPGPVAGWPPAFARMAEELAEALPATGALVLEHAHHLDDGHPTLGLVGRHLLPALPAQLAVVVTSHRDLPPAALPGSTARLASRDLRIAPAAARAMLERAAPGPWPRAPWPTGPACRGTRPGRPGSSARWRRRPATRRTPAPTSAGPRPPPPGSGSGC